MRKKLRRWRRDGLTGEELLALVTMGCLVLVVLALAWTERMMGIPLGEQLAALLRREPV